MNLIKMMKTVETLKKENKKLNEKIKKLESKELSFVTELANIKDQEFIDELEKMSLRDKVATYEEKVQPREHITKVGGKRIQLKKNRPLNFCFEKGLYMERLRLFAK